MKNKNFEKTRKKIKLKKNKKNKKEKETEGFLKFSFSIFQLMVLTVVFTDDFNDRAVQVFFAVNENGFPVSENLGIEFQDQNVANQFKDKEIC